MSGTNVCKHFTAYDVSDKSEITPSEYLATLRVLHIIRKKQSKKSGYVDKDLLNALRLVELYCPIKSGLKNITNLLYNS